MKTKKLLIRKLFFFQVLDDFAHEKFKKENWKFSYIGGGPLIYFSWGYKKWNLADPSHP